MLPEVFATAIVNLFEHVRNTDGSQANNNDSDARPAEHLNDRLEKDDREYGGKKHDSSAKHLKRACESQSQPKVHRRSSEHVAASRQGKQERT